MIRTQNVTKLDHLLKYFRDGLISLLYPLQCAGCESELAADAKPLLCADCREELVEPLDNDFWQYKIDCTDYPLIAYFAPFSYDSAGGAVVRAVKYEKQAELVNLLSPAATDLAHKLINQYDLNLIVPVPLHPIREKERGFNQSALLAGVVAENANLHCRSKALERVRNTVQQTSLPDDKRHGNVSDAFVTREDSDIAGQRILLIDDVVTTGATAAYCVYTLWAGGAELVVVLAATGVDISAE